MEVKADVLPPMELIADVLPPMELVAVVVPSKALLPTGFPFKVGVLCKMQLSIGRRSPMPSGIVTGTPAYPEAAKHLLSRKSNQPSKALCR